MKIEILNLQVDKRDGEPVIYYKLGEGYGEFKPSDFLEEYKKFVLWNNRLLSYARGTLEGEECEYLSFIFERCYNLTYDGVYFDDDEMEPGAPAFEAKLLKENEKFRNNAAELEDVILRCKSGAVESFKKHIAKVIEKYDQGNFFDVTLSATLKARKSPVSYSARAEYGELTKRVLFLARRDNAQVGRTVPQRVIRKWVKELNQGDISAKEATVRAILSRNNYSREKRADSK